MQDLKRANTLRGCGRKTIEAQLRLLRHSFLTPLTLCYIWHELFSDSLSCTEPDLAKAALRSDIC